MHTDLQKSSHSHLRDLLSQARAQSVYVARHYAEWAEWNRDRAEGPPDHLMEQEDWLIIPFQGLLEELYFASACFLEAHQLPGYRDLFLETFGAPFDAEAAARKHREAPWVPYESDPPINEFLSRLYRFLAPLSIEVEQKMVDDAEQRHQIGREFLEQILKGTASSLHRLGVVPASEPEVYKAMKKVIEPVFPSAKDASSGFFSTLKTYKPDILIPEVYSAVEYKFADSEEKLKSFFGQIAEDVKGYKGDEKYRWFYAVVYSTADFVGAARFQKAWEDHDFPSNWKAIYVVGASQLKKQKSNVVATSPDRETLNPSSVTG